MAASDARPVPRKNTAFRLYFAIRKNDGTLITSWTGADSEVSLDGASFSDCTSEATEIGTTGCGYVDLTASEMNADAVVYKLTVTNTGALPLVVTLFPEESGDYRMADSQKVDVNTIKTQAVTCAAGVTVYAHVGTGSADTAQTGDCYAIVNSGTFGNSALKTLIDTLDDFVDTEVAAIKAKTDNLPSDPADASDIAASFATVNSTLSTIAAYIDTEVATIVTQTTAASIRTAVGLAAANLDTQLSAIAGYIDTEVGAIYSRIGAPAGASIAADIAAVKAETAAIVDDTGTSGVVLATGSITAGVVATGAIDADALAADAVAEIWTTALTEAYRADGATGTGAQLLYELLQNVTEFGISGTTKTVKKIDGSTTAATYTLDSSTAPTSITRAT